MAPGPGCLTPLWYRWTITRCNLSRGRAKSRRTWAAAGPETPLDNFDFRGFVLTNTDGTEYHIEREDNGQYDLEPWGSQLRAVQAYGPPRLKRIVQRSGDRIEIETNCIQHFTATSHLPTRTISLERDPDPSHGGRIIGLRDPNGFAAAGAATGPLAVKYRVRRCRSTGQSAQVDGSSR